MASWRVDVAGISVVVGGVCITGSGEGDGSLGNGMPDDCTTGCGESNSAVEAAPSPVASAVGAGDTAGRGDGCCCC